MKRENDKLRFVDLHTHPTMYRWLELVGRRNLAVPVVFNEVLEDIIGAERTSIVRACEAGNTVMVLNLYSPYDEWFTNLNGDLIEQLYQEKYQRGLPDDYSAATSPYYNIEHMLHDLHQHVAEINRERLRAGGKAIHVLDAAEPFAEAYDSGAYDMIIIPALEGAHPVNHDLGKVRQLRQLGVRIIQLTHFTYKGIATSGGGMPLLNQSDPDFWKHRGADKITDSGSLSDFGRQLVRELVKHNILIDVSHTSEEGFWEVVEELQRLEAHDRRTEPTPLLASHVGVTGTEDAPIRPSLYNLKPEQIKEIVHRKGLIGLVLEAFYLRMRGQLFKSEGPYPRRWSKWKRRMERLKDAWGLRFGSGTSEALLPPIDHIAALTAEVTGQRSPVYKHIGIGTDFGGAAIPLRDVMQVAQVKRIHERLQENYSRSVADQILHDNGIELFKRTIV